MDPLSSVLAFLFFGFIGIVLLVIAYKTIRIVPQATVMIVQLTITGMRSVMGEMDLDHTLSNRDQINSKLRIILDEATDKWGVKVTRVDVKNINPPEDVRITMEKQMTAERNRRALVLQAEGDRQAAITRAEGEKQAAVTRAEGEKQSAILQAEGAAQARLRSAEAESEAITRISQAIGQGDPAQYLITTRYIESLRDMTRTNNSKVIFMPVETSSMLSSLGAIKEVLSATGDKGDDHPPSPRPRELNR
jgi:regulator of protease activity HflC (stomatin/prohibitin superfamily)